MSDNEYVWPAGRKKGFLGKRVYESRPRKQAAWSDRTRQRYPTEQEWEAGHYLSPNVFMNVSPSHAFLIDEPLDEREQFEAARASAEPSRKRMRDHINQRMDEGFGEPPQRQGIMRDPSAAYRDAPQGLGINFVLVGIVALILGLVVCVGIFLTSGGTPPAPKPKSTVVSEASTAAPAKQTPPPAKASPTPVPTVADSEEVAANYSLAAQADTVVSNAQCKNGQPVSFTIKLQQSGQNLIATFVIGTSLAGPYTIQPGQNQFQDIVAAKGDDPHPCGVAVSWDGVRATYKMAR